MGLQRCDRANSKEDILKFWKSMQGHVSSKTCRLSKVFPLGHSTNGLMLYGTAADKIKSGRPLSVDWAVRAHLVRIGDSVEIDLYQNYLVRSTWCIRRAEC